MDQVFARRHFVKTMAGIMGAGAAMSGELLPFKTAFAQGQDAVAVGWLRLACTGQSFVSEGSGGGAFQQLIIRHKLFNAGAETIEAIAAGALDSSYLGVTPAIAAMSRGVPARIYVGGHRRGMRTALSTLHAAPAVIQAFRGSHPGDHHLEDCREAMDGQSVAPDFRGDGPHVPPPGFLAHPAKTRTVGLNRF